MAKILVTGGCGYIGSHTLVDLVENGYDVVSVDNNSRSSASVLKGVEKITGKPIKNYKVDPARVYLSGISAGANFIMAWAGENDNNARKVAGIAPVAPCDVVNSTQARVISRNNLHVYAVKCSQDNCGAGNGA